MQAARTIDATWQAPVACSEANVLRLRQALQLELSSYQKCRSRLAIRLKKLIHRIRAQARQTAMQQLMVKEIELLHSAQRQYKDLIHTANHDCLDLCLSVLKSLGIELRLEQMTFLTNQIQSKIDDLSKKENFKVLCNPDCLEDLSKLLQNSMVYQSFKLEADSRVPRDGIILELSSGTIELSLSSQIEAIGESLQKQLHERLSENFPVEPAHVTLV